MAALVLFFGFGQPWPARAKSFTLDRVVVEATLNPDGSMRVVERIDYDFDGEFRRGTRPIPRGDYQIVDMTVTENGQPLPMHGAPYNLSWDYSAKDEKRTFDISYTVLGATKFGSDVGELYWQWVGPDQPGVLVVHAQVTVPGDGTGVKAWAHGPRNGRVQPGKVTTFDVSPLSGGQFVEGRVAVPVAAFSVPPGPSPRLPAIEREEREFIAADARKAADEQRRKERVQWAGLAFIPGIVLFILIWMRWGRDPRPSRDVGEYVHEPPDDPPAVVVGLMHSGTIKPEAFSATVMDLAQRGYLAIEEVTEKRIFRDKKDWRFTRQKAEDEALAPYERKIMKRLFHDGMSTTQSDLTAWAKSHPSEAKSFWEGFEKNVNTDLKARKYVKGGRALPYFLNFVLVAAVEAAGVLAISSGLAKGIGLGLACLVTGALLLVGTLLLRSRTPEGAQRASEWKAFGHMLRDFSRMEEAPIGHLVLWERYLVYAAALGVSEHLAKALAMRIPEEQQRSFAPWYVGGYDGHRNFGSIGHFGDSFGSSVHSAMVPSSSGSGGGFSGGGGGGGGGGGIGAS